MAKPQAVLADAPARGDGGRSPVAPTARGGHVDAAVSIAGTVVVQASGFVAGLLVARSLGAEARGVVALVALTYRQAAVVVSMGLDSALLHFGARAPHGLTAHSRRALLVGLGQGALAALAGWVLLRTALANAVSPARGVATIAAVAAPAVLVLTYGNAVLRGAGRLVEASIMEGVAAVSTLAVVVAGVVTDRLWLAVLGAAAGTMAGAALTAFLVHRLPAPGEPRAGAAGWGALLRYGFAGHAGTVFQNLNYRIDFYVVALLLSATDVGIYALAVSLAEALLLLPDALALVVMQRASTTPRTRATEVTLRLGLLAAVVGGGLLALAGRRLVPAVFGDGFADAPDAILALLPGILAIAVWKTLVHDLAGRGFPTVKSTSAGLALLVTLAADLLLIPPFGIVGAATASSIAYTAAAVVAVRRYRSVMGRPLAAVVLGR